MLKYEPKRQPEKKTNIMNKFSLLLGSALLTLASAGSAAKFHKWVDEAGLENCSVHGLRKAAAARLAELGCTEFEIMAITGHTTSKEETRYTRAASQKTRAESALKRISGEHSKDKNVPLFRKDN